MTDLERFISLLKDFGIEYEMVKGSDRSQGVIVERCFVYIEGGYATFYQRWEFDLDGKFLETGSYE